MDESLDPTIIEEPKKLTRKQKKRMRRLQETPKWYGRKHNKTRSITRRSIYTILRGLLFKEHSHKQEKARRVRQMGRGLIPQDQIMEAQHG